jgi:hypothetical protein
MIVHPLLELEVGGDELEVIHVVVTGVEGSAAEGCCGQEREREQKKKQERQA